MFARVTIRVSDADASRRFYETVLATLGRRPVAAADWGDFALAPAGDGAPVTRRLHLGFVAGSRAQVDAFWRAGVDNGYRDDGEPGPRPQYRHDYYGAFLTDPDGNSAEAVHHGALHAGDVIDHLWLRAADVRAAASFYETIAAYAGLTVADTSDDHAWFKGASGSFTIVSGEPTQHLHLSFAARDIETVDVLLDPNANVVELVNHAARA